MQYLSLISCLFTLSTAQDLGFITTCSTDNDCDAATPYCVSGYCSSYAITTCTADSDCTDASTPYCVSNVCSSSTSAITTCTVDSDCSDPTPYCYNAALSSVGYCSDINLCSVDDDCESGETCQSADISGSTYNYCATAAITPSASEYCNCDASAGTRCEADETCQDVSALVNIDGCGTCYSFSSDCADGSVLVSAVGECVDIATAIPDDATTTETPAEPAEDTTEEPGDDTTETPDAGTTDDDTTETPDDGTPDDDTTTETPDSDTTETQDDDSNTETNTDTPTETDTDTDTTETPDACTNDHYPNWSSDCNDCDTDGYTLEIAIDLKICSIPGRYNTWTMWYVWENAFWEILIALNDNPCGLDSLCVPLWDIYPIVANQDVQMTEIGTIYPTTADECPVLDDYCGSDGSAPQYTLSATIALYCGDETALTDLMNELYTIVDSFGDDFAGQLVTISAQQDTVCGQGFGHVSVDGEIVFSLKDATGTVIAEDGIDYDRSNAVYTGYCVAVLMVLSVLSLFI